MSHKYIHMYGENWLNNYENYCAAFFLHLFHFQLSLSIFV